ncbi:MAG: hypothetical protein ABR970_15450 [Roseiarcus sp.]
MNNINARDAGFDERQPPCVIGLAVLAKMAFRGLDLAPIAESLRDRGRRNSSDAAALMDLSLIELFHGRAESRARLQAAALELDTFYRHEPAIVVANPIRVLALATPGNLMANTPIEFLLEDADMVLDILYLTPGRSLPESLPHHDLAFVAVAEGEANRPALELLADRAKSWPRPLLNAPDRIARLTRDGACALLTDIPGVHMPSAARIDRAGLGRIAASGPPLESSERDCRFPVIVRPVGSHAGEGLEKLDDRAAIGAYLEARDAAEFYISPFVDYRGADGLFRKYRVAVIDGQAYACHLAISSHWMIHYLNADMIDNPQNRAEEAQFMGAFDQEFGARHRAGLSEIARRIGLDYFLIDCAETPAGDLLIFEVGNAMIVHAMDPESVFPYKAAPMKKLFGAFQAMLRGRVIEACATA